MKLVARCLVLGAAWLAALAPPLVAAPKKVLVVTVTTGFRHSSIPTAEKILEQLARESGEFAVEFVRQPPGQPTAPRRPQAGVAEENEAALKQFRTEEEVYRSARARWMKTTAQALEKLRPSNLANYDAVVFASTTGDLPLPDPQGFLDWIAQGNAFIGVHAATDTFHGFPPFIAMIGGEFKAHGAQVAVDCRNENPAHAACRHLPASWTVFDEIYQFQNHERGQVRGLLTLDRHPNERTPGYYPVAWTKNHGAGRVFYTSLGHREDVWDPAVTKDRRNPPEVARQFQRHLLGGIRWALGLAPNEAKPAESR